jgi:hypothetical protein
MLDFSIFFSFPLSFQSFSQPTFFFKLDNQYFEVVDLLQFGVVDLLHFEVVDLLVFNLKKKIGCEND